MSRSAAVIPAPGDGMTKRSTIRALVPGSVKRPLKAAYANRDIPWAYVRSWYAGLGRRQTFEDVRAYCMFIGYGGSGHSLVGSLLDAHPRIVIAHELDVLRLVQAGFGRGQLYSLILEKAREFTVGGRRWNEYEYSVPHQWQGRFEGLQVIGDKKGGGSTKRLQNNPRLLDRLRRVVGVPIRFVHVTRNPYDVITKMALKQPARLAASADRFFALCETVASVKRQVRPGEVLDVRHEALIEDPRRTLRQVCDFVGVGCTDEYVEDCASIVFTSPRKTRHSVEWPADLVDTVKSRMAAFDFLAGYGYDS